MRNELRALLLVALIASVASCGGHSSVDLPVVSVDDAHSQLDVPSGSKAELYSLPPGGSFLLDATSYEFRVPGNVPEEAEGPNSVQLIVDRGVYHASWDRESRRVVLDRSRLSALRDSPAFSGYTEGAKLVIAIGFEAIHDGKLDFFPYWVAMAVVEGTTETN